MASPAPTIETADLVVFLAVIRTGSFGRAAVDLQLAQPSVSGRIAALERRLGAQLFVRGARGTMPTPAGERLADYARRCLDLLAETEAAVRAEDVDRIVVAAPTSLSAAVFPAVLEAMAGSPVDVVCRIAHSDEAVAALVDGSAHAAFVLNRVLPAGLESRMVAESPMIVVVAPDHPAATLAEARYADLVGHPVVVHNWHDQVRDITARFADPRRGHTSPVRLVGSPDVAVEMGMHHGYVAVVPQFAAAGALRRGELVRVPLPDVALSLPVRLVLRETRSPRPGIAVLTRTLPALAERIAT
ncbi:LysR family transcriptional regulator [Actinomycetes bacterium KLBMP 9759]